MWAYTTTGFEGDYVFYYSNWGNTLATVVLWLLFASHCLSLSDYQHECIATLFEVALTMEYVINPLYWSLLYEPQAFDPSQLVSYRGPYMNHFIPWIYLNIEWWLNGFQFNLPGTMHVFFCEGILYAAVNYTGMIITGHPIYFFITFEDMRTVIVFSAIVVMQLIIYFCLTLINNYYKSDKSTSKQRAFSRHLEKSSKLRQ